MVRVLLKGIFVLSNTEVEIQAPQGLKKMVQRTAQLAMFKPTHMTKHLCDAVLFEPGSSGRQ